MNYRRFGVLLSLVGVVGAAPCGFAERPAAPLANGSPPVDVLKVWGEPSEQIEREVKREVEWRYTNGSSVTFREGAVVGWKTRDLTSDGVEGADGLRQPNKKQLSSPKVSAKVGKGAGSGNEALDFVRELAKEIPSNPDSPSSSSDSSSAPVIEPMSPPPPPPPASGLHGGGGPNGGVHMIEPRVPGRSAIVAPPDVMPMDDDADY